MHESTPMRPMQDYQRIFEELYPNRRQLYLAPRNECNVHKLVCTTLRPTQVRLCPCLCLPSSQKTLVLGMCAPVYRCAYASVCLSIL